MECVGKVRLIEYKQKSAALKRATVRESWVTLVEVMSVIVSHLTYKQSDRQFIRSTVKKYRGQFGGHFRSYFLGT